jgi:hypothetical protein
MAFGGFHRYDGPASLEIQPELREGSHNREVQQYQDAHGPSPIHSEDETPYMVHGPCSEHALLDDMATDGDGEAKCLVHSMVEKSGQYLFKAMIDLMNAA